MAQPSLRSIETRRPGTVPLVIEDHRGVVGGDGAVAERAERLAELLDREILPCLERPSRLIGPFDGAFLSTDAMPDIAWIWPSLAEGPDTPEPLRPVLESALLPPETTVALACAPAPDVERALASHHIPWFARPSLTPLSDVGTWIVWLETPLQLTGLLSVFAGAGVPPRATDREHGPRVLLSGPGAWRARELAAVYADRVVRPGALLVAGDPRAWFAAKTPGEPSDLVEGGRRAAQGPTLTRSGDERAPIARPRAGEPARWLVTTTGDVVDRPSRRRAEGRGDSFTETVFVGTGSAELRTRLGLITGPELSRIVAETLDDDAGALRLDFVVGLPGETEADRAAIPRLIGEIAAMAPRGPRQVGVRIGCHVPDDGPPLRAAEFEAAFDYLARSLPSRRTPVATVPAALGPLEWLMARHGADMAPALEAMHREGARRVDAPATVDAEAWDRVLRGAGIDPGDLLDGDAVPLTGVSAPTGFVSPRRTEATPDPSTKRRSRRRGEKTRPDRWTRWQALVPRLFDHRVEFAKRGRLRFLGAGEVTELFLRACARADIPLATSGVAQPRPKLSFGPSLPTGVEGLAEVVDLGLEFRVPDLLERLRPHLPSDLELRRMLMVPAHSTNVALSRVALTEYEAVLAPDSWNDTPARAASRARLETWSRRLGEGRPCTDDPSDVINQLRHVHLTGDPDGEERLVFTLDVRGSAVKCRPREVLSRGLEEAAVDVRCIPLRRLRLLVIEEEAGRERLVTPIQQALRVERRLRARAKLCA